MDIQELLSRQVIETESRIVLLVMDGLGGLPVGSQFKTELEMAKKPNMDKLAKEGALGLADPVGRGITPGSGPGHLALFGYDPVKYLIGRGVLEALGIDFPLKPGDVAIRINFCTVDDKGIITDRRAGRIGTEVNAKLCEKIKSRVKISGAEYFLEPVKEHRAVLVFRGKGLGDKINDSDPQVVGKPALEMKGEDEASKRTVKLVEEFLEQAKSVLKDEKPANMMLFRGFACFQKYPQFNEIYKLRSCAIAQYPMYRGLARLVGMDVLDVGPEMDDLFSALKENWERYNFFFIHIKKTDSAGEDGDWARKVEVIQAVDKQIPKVLKLKPDVLIITGDHSTPSRLKSHSWHPVPVLLWSHNCRPDLAKEFGERACSQGGLGRIRMKELMALALANALKLEKFGA